MNFGFFVNPLAGYGGMINNKGSDNLKISDPEASVSIKIAMKFIKNILDEDNFYIPSLYMGEEIFKSSGRDNYKIIYESKWPSSRDDTLNFLNKLKDFDVDYIIFVGGDGTARDIVSSNIKKPVIAIPAGVKMYSSIFCINVNHAIDLYMDVHKNVESMDSGVYDIDEDAYRSGLLKIKYFGSLMVPVSNNIVSSSKAEYNNDDAYDIAEYIIENMDDSYYIIGPGRTCKIIVESLGYKTNILGFDVIKNMKLIKYDVDEEFLYNISLNGKTKLIISPIGGQGFVLGRGNKQISGRVFDLIGFKNLILISDKNKINNIKNLYIDIDTSLEIPKYLKVITGYGIYTLKRLIK
ncbi:ATP-NAD kinase family protein [Picrophilus oshimae]|nr:ATP-NAD kinase family protein [Picrophilus oshimae]